MRQWIKDLLKIKQDLEADILAVQYNLSAHAPHGPSHSRIRLDA
jgi:hypothetical protein